MAKRKYKFPEIPVGYMERSGSRVRWRERVGGVVEPRGTYDTVQEVVDLSVALAEQRAAIGGPQDRTVEAVSHAYLAWVKEHHEHKYWSGHRTAIRKLNASSVGRMSVEHVKAKHILDFLTDLVDSEQYKKPYIRKIDGQLESFFKWAKTKRSHVRIKRSPFEMISGDDREVIYKKIASRKRLSFGPLQAIAILMLEGLTSLERAALAIAIGTGLRISTIVTIEWDDFQERRDRTTGERRIFLVIHHETEEEYRQGLKDGTVPRSGGVSRLRKKVKNQLSHEVEVPAWAYALVLEHKRVGGTAFTPFVFAHQKLGGEMRPFIRRSNDFGWDRRIRPMIRKQQRALFKEHKVLEFHQLRATFARSRIMGWWAPPASHDRVRAELQHSGIATTDRYLGRPAPATLDRWADEAEEVREAWGKLAQSAPSSAPRSAKSR